MQCQGDQKASDKMVSEKSNSDCLTEKINSGVQEMDCEISRPATKEKKHKKHEEAVNSTAKLDNQESVHLAEVNGDETVVPKKKRKKKHKEHTEIVTDSSENQDCSEGLVKVSRDEVEMAPKKKRKKKHKEHMEIVTDSSEKQDCSKCSVKVSRDEVELVPKKNKKQETCPEIVESTEAQGSGNQEMESLEKVNRDEVKRPRKKKNQRMEDTASTTVNSSASSVDHELEGDNLDEMPSRKREDSKTQGRMGSALMHHVVKN